MKVHEKGVETHLRTVLKTVTWRIVGTLDTLVISYFLTWNFTIAFSITGVELVTKTLLYYLHERGWNLIRWGRRNFSG